jgi:hypothetical protein
MIGMALVGLKRFGKKPRNARSNIQRIQMLFLNSGSMALARMVELKADSANVSRCSNDVDCNSGCNERGNRCSTILRCFSSTCAQMQDCARKVAISVANAKPNLTPDS